MYININANIEEKINSKGYALVSGSDIFINAILYKDVLQFIDYYNKLEVDKYVLEKEKKPYRKRRYGGFTLDIKNGSLQINEHKSFYQSNKVNKKYGGIKRTFAPIEQFILNNKFLQTLILEDFKKLPEKYKKNTSKWFIGVQLFRIETTNNYIGYPSPEGIHQDGHCFVIQHFINKSNIKGGKSLIYSLKKEKLLEATFKNFLDSCYVKDDMVMHDVTPIECINQNKKGVRDMLILDFEIIK